MQRYIINQLKNETPRIWFSDLMQRNNLHLELNAINDIKETKRDPKLYNIIMKSTGANKDEHPKPSSSYNENVLRYI